MKSIYGKRESMKKITFLIILIILVKIVSSSAFFKCKNQIHIKKQPEVGKEYQCYVQKRTILAGINATEDTPCYYCGCPASDHDNE